MASGVTLINNEIEYVVKVIKYLENRGILLKGTTEKNNIQETGFLRNFLGPLTKLGLPLMKKLF